LDSCSWWWKVSVGKSDLKGVGENEKVNGRGGLGWARGCVYGIGWKEERRILQEKAWDDIDSERWEGVMGRWVALLGIMSTSLTLTPLISSITWNFWLSVGYAFTRSWTVLLGSWGSVLKSRGRRWMILRKWFLPAARLFLFWVPYITYLPGPFCSIRLVGNLILYYIFVGKLMGLPLMYLLLIYIYFLLWKKLWLSLWLGKVEPLVGNFSFLHWTHPSPPTNS